MNPHPLNDHLQRRVAQVARHNLWPLRHPWRASACDGRDVRRSVSPGCREWHPAESLNGLGHGCLISQTWLRHDETMDCNIKQLYNVYWMMFTGYLMVTSHGCLIINNGTLQLWLLTILPKGTSANCAVHFPAPRDPTQTRGVVGIISLPRGQPWGAERWPSDYLPYVPGILPGLISTRWTNKMLVYSKWIIMLWPMHRFGSTPIEREQARSLYGRKCFHIFAQVHVFFHLGVSDCQPGRQRRARH